MMRSRLACLLLLAASPAFADAPDPAALVRAARESMERVEHQAASWTSDQTLPGGSHILVDVLRTPTRRRLTLSIAIDGRRVMMTRIIERDGVWYVTDSGVRGKYRPYEAPTRLPLTYFYLGRADLFFATEPTAWTYDSTAGTVATYRSPLSGQIKRQVETAVNGLGSISSPTAETKARLAGLKALLEKGVTVEVDTANGIVVAHGRGSAA